MSDTHLQNMLAATFNRSVQRALQADRVRSETLAEQTVRDGIAQGHVEIGGEGESQVAVRFPMAFVEKPVFTSGLEIGDGAWLVQGAFPVWSASVAQWDVDDTRPSPMWIGASLAVVVFGLARSILHYQFTARSFTPAGTSQRVSAPL